jgi:uncharacterized YigZ family protein
MLFDDSYFTIKNSGEGVFRDRGSKFLGFAFPVKSETEVKEILAKLRKEHHGANHHCYAFRLGADKQHYRANDDGEPGNSAGRPILGQIQSRDLTNVLVVVARYFGGTLLGVSGLINAYKNAASEALSACEIVEEYILFEYLIEFPYSKMNEVMKQLKDNECKIKEQLADNNCSIRFVIRKNHSERAEEALKNIQEIKLTFIKTI